MLPTDQLIKHFPRLHPLQARALERLGLETVRDLLWHFPARYGAVLPERKIAELVAGEEVLLYAQVVSAKTSKAWKKKMAIGEVTLEDPTGRIKAVWFHQPYLAKKVPPGHYARVSGKVAERKLARRSLGEGGGELYLANPEIELATGLSPNESLFTAVDGGEENYLLPVYPESRGVSSSWFHHAIKKILKEGVLEQLVDPLPAAMLEKYHLPSLATALVWIHSPRNEKDSISARKRFAFEEIFFIQLARLKAKADYQSGKAYGIKADKKVVDDFIRRFAFPLTKAQTRAIAQILEDFAQPEPMTRLLEGDVGSGKTAVAASTALAIVNAGYEVGYMAPTEILAKQHFESFISYFKYLPGIQIGLITGAGCYKFPSKINPSGYTNISRPQLLKWVANGEIPILIGTHALIQKAVKFKNLAYVIIDEQHRFGVMQRAKLVRKQDASAPHLLSMTATPIPRTLALTLYGDLDLTLLDELPPGRKPIQTTIIPDRARHEAYTHIKTELAAGRQAYVICPRIAPTPEGVGVPTSKNIWSVGNETKAATTEAKRLQTEVFPDYTVGLVHSKMTPKAKEEIMSDFASGKIDILVATSVVEVGVNVPNATIIIIEGAERFGLAQLHQLRGRVLRSSHQAYCYLFTSTAAGQQSARLKALQTAKNGFELAELDLGLRGAGSLSAGLRSGVASKQWGLSDIGMEAIKNLKMVEAARSEAQHLLKTDPAFKKYPLIRERLSETQKSNIHFE